jgi:hypothetical protein
VLRGLTSDMSSLLHCLAGALSRRAFSWIS